VIFRIMLLLALCVMCDSALGAGGNNELQGCYVERTYTSYITDSEEKWVRVYNFLKISETPDTKLKFSAVLNGDKSQICYAFGTLTIEKKGVNTILAVTPDEEVLKWDEASHKCKLQILSSPNSFKFQQSNGSECNSLFLCGDHAYIAEHVFYKKNKVKLNDSRCTP